MLSNISLILFGSYPKATSIKERKLSAKEARAIAFTLIVE
jgi:hypothetical protein